MIKLISKLSFDKVIKRFSFFFLCLMSCTTVLCILLWLIGFHLDTFMLSLKEGFNYLCFDGRIENGSFFFY